VRELKNTIERSVYRSGNPEKPIADIAFDPFDSPFRLPTPTGVRAAERPSRRKSPLLPTNLNQRMQQTETELLDAALEKARYNQKVAADLLGLSYHQFRGKLRKYDISGKAPA
jgi:psp operon transcriptional activator